MRGLGQLYPEYVARATSEIDPFGFDIDTIAQFQPVLAFLYEDWWKVELTGLEFLPKTGPALLVGNAGGALPWPGLMLLYALMTDKRNPRRLAILANMDWIGDERLHRLLLGLGFVPFSATNAKQLFAAGHLVAIFPEGAAGLSKPYSERYRLRPFDWTKLLPATEEQVPQFPVATLGCDEAVPVLGNLDGLARFLNLPAFPITPFFPWMPFPLNLLSLPGAWQMRVLKSHLQQVGKQRDELENTAKSNATLLEGGIQAELNRLLRARLRGGAH